MKNVWKRTLSLMLSSVLLLGSVPMGAFATEQTQEPTELVEEIPPVVAVVKDEVANVELDVPKVCVNDTEIASGDVFSNGTVVYDAAQKTLTLNEATNLTGISVEGQSLTIYLVGSNKIDAVDAVAITADKDLTITGEGSLKIVTNNAVAVSVAGVADGDNQKGLIIDGAQVSVETAFVMTETEIPVGISSANGVVIKGAAHFRTSHSRSVDKYTMECNGYLNDKVYTANSACDGGSALEFIGDEHVGEWITGNNEHYKTCSESSCALYENTAVGNHPIDDTPKYESISNTKHCVMYNCCNKVKEGLGSEKHDLNYSIADSAIQVICADCRATGSITLSANDTEKGSEELDVSYTTAGILAGKEPEIIYTNAAKEEVTPEALGKYTVTMSYGGQTVTKEVEITKINISGAVVTVGGIYTYNGTAHELEDVTVTLNGGAVLDSNRYTLSYERKAADSDEFTATDDLTNAGNIRVTATVKADDAQYTGSASTTFYITKAEVPDDAYSVALPTKNPVYDGQEKRLECNKKSEYAQEQFGVATAEFYQTVNGTETKVSAINAGTYTVKIRVAESDNYNEKVLPGTETFTIDKADVGANDAPNKLYIDKTNRTQTIVSNSSFEPASFAGVYVQKGAEAADDLNSDITYYYGDSKSTKQTDTLMDYIDGQENDTDIPVRYSMKPGNPNYTGETKLQTIMVRKVDITFKLDEEESFAPTDLLTKGNTITYGDTDFLSLDGLTAHVGDKSDAYDAQVGNFFVKYTGDGVQGEKDAPEVKYNKFTVFYSGELNGTKFEDVPVCGPQYLTVNKKTPAVTVKPAAELVYPANGQDQILEVATTDGGTLKYRIHGQTSWEETLTLKDAAVYWVYYKVEGGDNYKDLPESLEQRKITVKVLPNLRATYKDKLSTVTLPDGWTWELNNEKLENLEVGPAGEYGPGEGKEEYQFTMAYNADKNSAQHPTATGEKIFVKVDKLKTKVTVTLLDKYLKYESGQKVEAKVTVRAEGAATDLPANEYAAVCSNITNTTDTEVKNPGRAQIKVAAANNGNYEFLNDEAELTKEYVVYWPIGLDFTDTWKFAEHQNTDMDAKGYPDGKSVKAELNKKLDDTQYPVTQRKYLNFTMKEGERTYVYNPVYWPDDGVTFTLSYPANVNKEDALKIYAMYTVTAGENEDRAELGTVAGSEPFEITEASGTELGINEYQKTETQIKIRLKNYAAICIAATENPDKEYDVTTKTNSSSKGTIKFKGTTVTTASASGKAKKGEVITVNVSPATGYELTRLNYSYISGTEKVTTAIDKDSNGKYTFTMPAASVEINATFDKKKVNPSSGDSSNIYLWVVILAASGAAIGALMAFWFKKRKK